MAPRNEIRMLMSALPPLAELENAGAFRSRHIGPDEAEQAHMLSVVGAASRRALVDAVMPADIARTRPMALPDPVDDHDVACRHR